MSKTLKIITLLSAFLLINFSCESKKVVVNREVNTKNGGQMLLGHQTKNQLLKAPYSEWYLPQYDEYAMDQKSIAALKKEKLNSYQIILVMGTWCEDSHREVPRLFKILEATGFPEGKLTIIAVNRKRESPRGDEGPYNIQRVPTIIVQKYGKEVGRIIESPETGYLERDLLQIITK